MYKKRKFVKFVAIAIIVVMVGGTLAAAVVPLFG